MTSETSIFLAVAVLFALIIWLLYRYNKSHQQKKRSPYEEMVYQEEQTRLEARRDFQKDKHNKSQNERWRSNLGRNIKRSWRF